MRIAWLLPLTLMVAGCENAPEPDGGEQAAASPAAAPEEAAAAPQDWGGTYVAELLVPNGTDEVTGAIDYSLALGKDSCALTAQGFQTDLAIACTATAQGGDLAIAFKSFADGKLTNQNDVQPYEVGEVLITLSQSGSRIVGNWGALAPFDENEPLEFRRK